MSFSRIFVLLNLKPGVSRAAYEEWARSTDLPIVNSLRSVHAFDVFACTGLLGSTAKPPYEYIEVIDVADMMLFGEEVSSKRMKSVAAAFEGWADPVFVTTRQLVGAAE